MPTDYPNVVEQINNQYYELTVSEKRLADFILSNLERAQYLSLAELAKACQVAEATASRFCRRLDYRNFNDFKLAVSKASMQAQTADNPLTGEISPEDSMADIYQKLYTTEVTAISQTMELLSYRSVQEAANMLEQAKRVLCMGQGGSMLIATEAAALFSTVSNKFSAVVDSHLQALAATTADPEDVVFYFSYSGATTDMVETLRLAKDRGASVILMTRFPNAPGAVFADLILQCGARENPLQAGSVCVKIACLYILDVLFAEYTRKNLEQCLQAKSRIADALAEKHL